MDVSYNKAHSNVSAPKSVSALMQEMAKKSHSRYAQSFEELIKKYENMEIESDILDIRKLNIVKDHGMLKNSEKRKFGYCVNYVQRTENEQQRLDDLIERIVKPKFGLKQPTSTMTTLDSFEINEETVTNKSQICIFPASDTDIGQSVEECVKSKTLSELSETVNCSDSSKQILNSVKKANSKNIANHQLSKHVDCKNKTKLSSLVVQKSVDNLSKSNFEQCSTTQPLSVQNMIPNSVSLSEPTHQTKANHNPMPSSFLQLRSNTHILEENNRHFGVYNNECKMSREPSTNHKSMSSSLVQSRSKASALEENNSHFYVNDNGYKNSCEPSTLSCSSSNVKQVVGVENIENGIKRKFDFKLDSPFLCLEPYKPTKSKQCPTLYKPPSISSIQSTNKRENLKGKNVKLPILDVHQTKAIHKSMSSSLVQTRSNSQTEESNRHLSVNNTGCKSSFERNTVSCSSFNVKKMVGVENVNNDSKRKYDFKIDLLLCSEPCKPTKSKQCSTLHKPPTISSIENTSKRENPKGKSVKIYTSNGDGLVSRNKNPPEINIPQKRNLKINKSDTEANMHKKYASSNLLSDGNANKLHILDVAPQAKVIDKSMSSSLVQTRSNSRILEESNRHLSVNNTGCKSSFERNTVSCSSFNVKKMVGVENVNDSERKYDFEIDLLLCSEPCKPTKSKQCYTLHKPPTISSIENTSKRENPKGKSVKIYTSNGDGLVSRNKNPPEINIPQKRNFKINKSDTEANIHKKYASSNLLSDGNANKLHILDVAPEAKAIDKSMSSSLVQTRSNSRTLEESNRHLSVNNTGCKSSFERNTVSCSSFNVKKMVGVKNVNNDTKRKYDFEIDLLLCSEPCKPTKSKQCSSLHKLPSISSIENTSKRENPKGKSGKIYTSNDNGLVSRNKNPQTKIAEKNLEIDKSCVDTRASGNFCNLNTPKQCASSNSLSGGNANKSVLDVAPSLYANFKLPIPESVLNSPGSFCLGDSVKRADVSSIPPKKQKKKIDFKSNTCTEQPKNRKKQANLFVSKSTKRKSQLARDLSKNVKSNQSNQSNKLINIFGNKSSPHRLKQNSISVSEPLTCNNRGFTNAYPPEDKTKRKTKNETSKCNAFFVEPNSVVDTTFTFRLSHHSFMEYSKSSFLTL